MFLFTITHNIPSPLTFVPCHTGPEDATSIVNPELIRLKRQLATREAMQKLDGFGYYM